jgi:putative glutamine amidotransferase
VRPLIGISTSTLVSSEPSRLGMRRFALPTYYVSRVEEAGGVPVMLPYATPEVAEALVQRLDGVLLSGGVDVDPAAYGAEPHARLGEVDLARDTFELALVKAAHAAGRPVLAICRGMQLANVAFGGTLVQDIDSQVAGALRHEQNTTDIEQPSHSVTIEPGTELARLAGGSRVRVNSFHHQSVERLAPGFRITARAADGVIEAMEHEGRPWFQCVQWHPERLPTDALTHALFASFVQAAEGRSRSS